MKSIRLICFLVMVASTAAMGQSPAAAPGSSASSPKPSPVQPTSVTPAESTQDSIGQRAARARAMDEAKADEELSKRTGLRSPTGQSNAMPAASGMRLTSRAMPNEVLAIRGMDSELEAALSLNGRRVVASMRYPSLGDGWLLVSISESGVVINRAKERLTLSFITSEPYLRADQPVIAPPVIGAMPQGNPGPMPVVNIPIR